MGLFKLRKQNSDTANEVADVDEWLKALDADVDTALAGPAPADATSEDEAGPNVDVAAALAGPSNHDAPLETLTPVTSTETFDVQASDDVWHLPDLDNELPTRSGTASLDVQPAYEPSSDVSGTTVDPSDFAGATFDPTSLQLESLDEPAAGFAILHSAEDLPTHEPSSTAEFGIPDDIPLWGQAEPVNTGDLVATMPVDQPVTTESAFSQVFDDAHRSIEALRPETEASQDTASLHDNHEVLPQPAYDLADFGVVLDNSPESTTGSAFTDADSSILSDANTDVIAVPEGAEAATCLAILGLDRNVTWTEVKAAHGSLISDHLAAGESDPERAQLARSIRREINTAYVSLRLMNGPAAI